MYAVRIRGVAKLAHVVGCELSRPIFDAQKEKLRRLVSGSIRKIDYILAEQNAAIEVLPHPTGRAYDYLSGMDFDFVATVASADADSRACRGVSFAGLPAHWERILDTMAPPAPLGGRTRSTPQYALAVTFAAVATDE